MPYLILEKKQIIYHFFIKSLKTMLEKKPKVALIIGHPGHELRIYRFLELYQPRIYVLTDGSGPTHNSRISSTEKIVASTQSEASSIMGLFSDKEIYNIILKGDFTIIQKTVDTIVEDMKNHDIEMVVGDGIEGFNPTHDLCRYMINEIVRRYEEACGKLIPNYDFLLDGLPNYCPSELKDEALWVKLGDEDIARKFEAAKNYPELKEELDKAIKNYGIELFKTECLRPVKGMSQIKNWTTPVPFYESYGTEKVRIGQYKHVISFEEHLLPIVKFLSSKDMVIPLKLVK